MIVRCAPPTRRDDMRPRLKHPPATMRRPYDIGHVLIYTRLVRVGHQKREGVVSLDGCRPCPAMGRVPIVPKRMKRQFAAARTTWPYVTIRLRRHGGTTSPHAIENR